METIGTETFDLDLGNRLITIVLFLVFFWAIINWFSVNIKNGKIKIPEFLKSKFPGLSMASPESEIYKIEIVQRKNLNDGNELMVARVDGKDILLSRNLHTGIRFLKNLDQS